VRRARSLAAASDVQWLKLVVISDAQRLKLGRRRRGRRRVAFGEPRRTAAGVQASTKLTPKDAVDDEVDGRIRRYEQVADVIVVEIHLQRHTHTP